MRFHVLSIGISQYLNINSLKYADKDAADFYTLFTSNLGASGYSAVLTDSQATLAGIKSALGQDLRLAVSKDDAFFFLFSGHGTYGPDANGNLTQFIAPYDATMDFASSCISVDDLKQSLEALRCQASFVFLDSCFSGGMTSKTIPTKITKEAKSVKVFLGDLGVGGVVMTACLDSEQAIEDSELQNGLFTHACLSELQKERTEEKYSVQEIYDPIVDAVHARAREVWSHDQTPTASINLHGKVYLPTFRKPLRLSPDLLKPQIDGIGPFVIQPPTVDTDSQIEQDVIDTTLALIVQARESSNALATIKYRQHCYQLLEAARQEWEDLFARLGGDASNLPELVSRLEASTYQILIFAALVTMFGSDAQMKTFTEAAVTILDWQKEKNGLVSVLSAPEIVLLNIIYVVAIVAIVESKLLKLNILLDQMLDEPDNGVGPTRLMDLVAIHYCAALGGSAEKVGDHVRSLLQSFDWLKSLMPKMIGKVTDFQLQANFLLALIYEQHDFRLYPDFGRFYGSRLTHTLNKIKYDLSFQQDLAKLLGVDVASLRPAIFELMEKISRSPLAGHFWSSIGPGQVLTPEERKGKGIRN